MSNVELALYLGCRTAYGNMNLCSESVAAGAANAIGFTEEISYDPTIDCNEMEIWLLWMG